MSDDIRLTSLVSQGDNGRFEHAIGITAKLAAGLSLKVSYGIRYSNFPPPGFKKTDTVSSVSRVATFATPRDRDWVRGRKLPQARERHQRRGRPLW